MWSCIDVSAVRVKVSRGIEPFSPIGIDSADTIVNCPMGRFAWTNHIYLQITQPGSISVNCKTKEMTWGEKEQCSSRKSRKKKK